MHGSVLVVRSQIDANSLHSFDQEHNRVVALKVIDVDTTDYKVNARAKDDTIEDTVHEIKVLSQLKDSKVRNVNTMFDAFQVHSQLWIVNDYCPGGSVHTLVSLLGHILLFNRDFLCLSLSISLLYSFCYYSVPFDFGSFSSYMVPAAWSSRASYERTSPVWELFSSIESSACWHPIFQDLHRQSNTGCKICCLEWLSALCTAAYVYLG